MSVKIRLSLTGKTHQISYRIVAQDTHSKRDGKFLEILGSLNPQQKADGFKINKDRIKYYLSRGATFTPSAKYVFENGKLAPKPKKQRQKQDVQKQQNPAVEPKPEEITANVNTNEEIQPAQNQEKISQDQSGEVLDEPKHVDSAIEEPKDKNE